MNTCQLSTDNSTNLYQSWRPFHIVFLVFSSRDDFQLNWQLSSLTNQPTTSPYSIELPKTSTLELDWHCIEYFGTNNIKNTVYIVIVQQYLDVCMRIRCRWNSFTEHLASDRTGIVDVFTGRYLEAGVCLSPYCIATDVHVPFEFCAQQPVYTPQYIMVKLINW
jgi:hypothetical protein